ncbi:hypothetical protein [Priestia endophytica]|nr:hypothetical protein [Priestia endophytica]
MKAKSRVDEDPFHDDFQKKGMPNKPADADLFKINSGSTPGNPGGY